VAETAVVGCSSPHEPLHAKIDPGPGASCPREGFRRAVAPSAQDFPSRPPGGAVHRSESLSAWPSTAPATAESGTSPARSAPPSTGGTTAAVRSRQVETTEQIPTRANRRKTSDPRAQRSGSGTGPPPSARAAVSMTLRLEGFDSLLRDGQQYPTRSRITHQDGE
jgi:hypothetical protein